MVSGLFTFLSSAARVLLWQATLPLENAYWYKSLMLGVRSGSDVSPWPWPWSLRPKSKSLALALALGSKSLALKVVLRLGRGLGQAKSLALAKAKAKDHFQDSIGQLLSCYTPVSITYTTALQVWLWRYLFTLCTQMEICAPWILVWENSGCSCQRSPRWKSF